MRHLLALALLASTSVAALADGVVIPDYVAEPEYRAQPTYSQPQSGYTYREEYRQFGNAPIVIDRRPILQEQVGPIFVVPPPGYYGPPISLRRYNKLLERGQDPFYGYEGGY